MTKVKYNKDDCLALLRAKSTELTASGCARLPNRSDFSDEEVVAVKAFLGPWPRALEAAGLKDPRSTDRLEHNRDKRARAKRRRTEQLKSDKLAARQTPAGNKCVNVEKTPDNGPHSELFIKK